MGPELNKWAWGFRTRYMEKMCLSGIRIDWWWWALYLKDKKRRREAWTLA